MNNQNLPPLLLLKMVRLATGLLKRSPAERGFRMARMQALSVIQEMPGVTIKQLAHELTIKAPSATQAVELLVQENFVERRADSLDRRSTRLYLTAKGSNELTTLVAGFDAELNKLLGLLSPQEKNTLLEIFGKLMHELTKRRES